MSVVSALHYLHTQLRVIHRDVKPSNILISRSGQVKICDFGISGEAAYASCLRSKEGAVVLHRLVSYSIFVIPIAYTVPVKTRALSALFYSIISYYK